MSYRVVAISCLALSFFVCCSISKASPIVYSGDLSGYGTASGAVSGDSLGLPDEWTYWSFTGSAGDPLNITVRRTDGELDPIFAIWFGAEADTDDFDDMFLDGLTTTLLGTADDELPPAIPGPFGDPTFSIILPADGVYTIAVADHSATSTPAFPLLGYTITAEVPEAGSLVLMTCGGALIAGYHVRSRRTG